MATKNSFFRWIRELFTKNKFYIIIALILFIVMIEFGSLFLTMQIMSGMRVFVAAESIYSKAQKSAYISLLKYSADFNEADYQEFLRLMDKGPITTIRFREALDRSSPDINLARQILFNYWDSGNVSDFNDQIFLYRYFRNIPAVNKVMQNWFNGNLQIPGMLRAGERIHSLINSPYDQSNADQKNIRDAQFLILKQEASDVNNEFDRLQKRFTLQMGQLSVVVKNGLIWFNVVLSIILALFVMYIAYIIQRISIQVEKEKQDFMRIANHQLNTPISIMQNAHAMVQDGSLELQKGFEYMGGGLTRVVNVFNDIKTVLEFDGKVQYEFKKNDMVPIMDQALAYAQKTIATQKKEITVTLQQPTFTLPQVMCDVTQLNNALYNLLDNAVYYTPKGTITISYELIDKKYLKINIKDTGIGFAPEDKEKLGQKFYRTKKALLARPDGSGLGLYICKNITQAHGGQLFFDSPGEGRGATFSFTLPVAR